MRRGMATMKAKILFVPEGDGQVDQSGNEDVGRIPIWRERAEFDEEYEG